MPGAYWEQETTDQNFNDVWNNIQTKLKSMVSSSGVSDLHECTCEEGDPVDIKICTVCDGFWE